MGLSFGVGEVLVSRLVRDDNKSGGTPAL